MEEIRFIAGPIVARYMDKVEEERQAVLKAEEEKAAKKKAELEARRKAEDDKKKEDKKENKVNGTDGDAEMTDVETLKADGVEEPMD